MILKKTMTTHIVSRWRSLAARRLLGHPITPSLVLALTGTFAGSVAAQPGTGAAASPAARPIPAAAVRQTATDAVIAAGAVRFAADCGFCHGRDATGGAGGADLTRSTLVAADTDGGQISGVVRNGLPDLGMPPFTGMSADELNAIVAFLHDRQANAATLEGGRRSVLAEDLRTGNAGAGRRYFEDQCVACHSASGDLAGIGSRYEGLTLLRRMLYPGSEGRGAGDPPALPTVTLTTPEGVTISAPLEYQDEFTIGIRDNQGRYRSWSTDAVQFTIAEPLNAHIDLLPRYTDVAIHDLYAYLETLRDD